MGTRLHNLLSRLTSTLWRFKWHIIALAAGSLLPDALKVFHNLQRGWEHSTTTAWITAGLLGVSIGLFLVGLAVSLNFGRK